MAGNNTGSDVGWELRRVMWATIVVAAVTGLVFMLVRWHDVVFLLFVAIVISTAIKPAVEWLQRRGVPRPIGIISVYVVGIAVLALMIMVAAPLVAEQISRISDAVPGAYRSLRNSMLQTSNLFIWRLGLALPAQLPLTVSEVEEGEAAVVGVRDALRMVSPVVQAILGILVTFVMAFYWTVEGERIKRAALMILPIDRREPARELLATLEAQLGKYIVGQGLLMASIAIISLAGYLVMGLPYALVLALFAGLMEAVPLVGPALGAIPAIAVAYSVEPTLAIWVLVFTLVVQQLENNILVPRIMRRSVGVHPLVTLLALTALSTLFGITGAIVAVPLAAILQILFFRFVVERETQASDGVDGSDLFSVERYEAQDLVRDMRRQLRDRQTPDTEEHSPIVDDLEAIAVELNELLAGNQNGESTPVAAAGSEAR